MRLPIILPNEANRVRTGLCTLFTLTLKLKEHLIFSVASITEIFMLIIFGQIFLAFLKILIRIASTICLLQYLFSYQCFLNDVFLKYYLRIFTPILNKPESQSRVVSTRDYRIPVISSRVGYVFKLINRLYCVAINIYV